MKNYISGARTWIEEHRGINTAFNSPQFGQLIKSFVKKSNHVTIQAPPLTPRHIRLICQFLDNSPSASLAIKPALLIGYSCFLRGSNLFPASMSAWAGPHTLLTGDIRDDNDHLLVIIRSTKTRAGAQAFAFKIPQDSDTLVCPLSAWRRYQHVARPWALGPAFLHANNLPVTGRQVVVLMRLALRHETDIDPRRVTIHSLRRGATHTSVQLGIPIETIETRGTWSSDSGVRPYLPHQSRKVPTVPVINLAS